MKRTVTFDFDHTLKFETGEPNKEGIDRFRRHQTVDEVHVVTTRFDKPESRIEVKAFLRQHGLEAVSIRFTDGKDKLPTLLSLGSELHHEDDEVEIAQIEAAGIKTVNLFVPEKWQEHMESL